MLADPDGAALPGWLAGQSVALRVPAGLDRAMAIRNYSLSNAAGSDRYRIAVKRESRGAVSQYVHARVVTGDSVDVAAPAVRSSWPTVTRR